MHYPLRHGSEFNLVAVFRTASHAEKGDPASYRAELENTYRDMHPIDARADWHVGSRPALAVADRDPVRHWHKGRIVLLGDAAHRAAAIAGAGRLHGDRGWFVPWRVDRGDGRRFRGGVPRFETTRLLRTARVQLESRSLWDFYHLDEGVARDVRNATVADWDEAHLFDCLSWLYDGAPVPAAAGR